MTVTANSVHYAENPGCGTASLLQVFAGLEKGAVSPRPAQNTSRPSFKRISTSCTCVYILSQGAKVAASQKLRQRSFAAAILH